MSDDQATLGFGEPAYTIDELIDCAQREVAMRQRVYPRQVELHKMDRRVASAELAKMGVIHAILLRIKHNKELDLEAMQDPDFAEVGE